MSIVAPATFIPNEPSGIAGVTPNVGTTDSNRNRVSEPEIFDAGIGTGSYEPIEPTTATINSGTDDSGIRRTRNGRIDRRTRAGRTGVTTGETTPGERTLVGLEKFSLTDILYSLHLVASQVVVPEMELDKEEAAKIGNAIAEVNKHYAMTFDPKKVAIVNLFVVMIAVYWSHVIAYKLRKELEKDSKPAPTNVPTPITTPKHTTRPKLPQEMSPSDLFYEPAGTD